MADLSDVELTLVSLVSQVLYPTEGSDASVIGPLCRIYRGWPLPTALNSDLENGFVNITVFPANEPGQVTRYFTDESGGPAAPPTLAASVFGTTITFSGTAMPGQTAGLRVDDKCYVYRLQTGDTTASVAANLAAMVGVDQTATCSGSSLTVPAATLLVSRIIADATWQQQIRRQSHLFHIAFWCPSPELRDRAVIAVDQTLAGLTWVAFEEGTVGRITYAGTIVSDHFESARLYRRDLLFSVEYPTIVVQDVSEMLFGNLTLNTDQVIV